MFVVGFLHKGRFAILCFCCLRPSMGLDAGYRRLFLDVLHDFAAGKGKTIFVTSHIIQDLEQLVDTMIFIDKGEIMQVGLEEFLAAFRKYVFHCDDPPDQTPDQTQDLAQGHVIRGIERRMPCSARP